MTSLYNPWLHRYAVLTACSALLPITVGALVTTLGAGMAFLDWPSSDGHNMFLYPWFRDIAEGRTDKVVEHGHRLAGALIGLVSIGLAVLAWKAESRRWVRFAALGVLLAVIAQGILGGQRVELNARGLAMVHGIFAAWVFSLMACVAVSTSRAWFAPENAANAAVARLRPWALAVPTIILLQYVLGAGLRHRGAHLYLHLGFAFVVLALVIVNAVLSSQAGNRWVRNASLWLLALVVLQLLVGAGAWVSRFGFPPLGYVAVYASQPQLVLRTGHTVVAMMIQMTAVVYALRVFRASRGLSHTAVPARLAEGGNR